MEAEKEKVKMLTRFNSEYSCFESQKQKDYFLKHDLKKSKRNQVMVLKIILANSSKPPATIDNINEVYPDLKNCV